MINEREVLDALAALKCIGDRFTVPCDASQWKETRDAIVKLARPWEDTWGTEIICDHADDGVLVQFVAIKNGSPLKSRVKMPWFGMEVGETRTIERSDKKIGTIRATVSMFCSKLGQRISVTQHGKSGFTLHRAR